MTATVSSAATSLLGLVDQVLDLAKIEEKPVHGRDRAVRSARQPCPAAHAAGPAGGRQGPDLRLRLAPDTPYRLRGGPRQLHQALVNLVGNAIKFTDHGRGGHSRGTGSAGGTTRSGCALRSRTRASARRRRRRQHLFERFARSDDSVRRGISGSGLGLNITRELVAAHGWHGRDEQRARPGLHILARAAAWPRVRTPTEVSSGSAGGSSSSAAGTRQWHWRSGCSGFGCEARCVATAESAAELLRHAEGRQAVRGHRPLAARSICAALGRPAGGDAAGRA